MLLRNVALSCSVKDKRHHVSTQRRRGRPLSTGPVSDERPRVLHFLCTNIRAGVAEHVLSLATRLEKHGFVAYIAAPPALLHELASDLSATRVRTIPADMSSPLDIRESIRLMKIFKKEGIDLLHCHLVIASFCSAVQARTAGVKAVVETCHGRETWREGKWLKRGFWLDRQIGRCVDRHIAVSDAVGRHLISSKRIPASKVTVIRNGRDLTVFRPPTAVERTTLRTTLGLCENDTAVLTLGRLSEEKGQALAIEAISSLAPKWPRLHLLLAGEGPSEPELCRKAAELGVSNRVRFLGYRADAAELLRAVDLVLMPSLSEGLPLVAVEALASKRTVVATNVGGTSEVIVDGETGLLVTPGAFQLAGAIDRVLGDPCLAKRLASNGRQFVEQHFDINTQVERTASLYRSVLGSIL